MDPENCPSCGSSRLEAAVLEGMVIRLDRAGTLSRVFSVGTEVHCKVCMDCGAVSDLRGDPAKLAAKLPP